MKGNLLAGLQFEHFSVADYSNGAGEDYTGDLQSGIGYDYLRWLEARKQLVVLCPVQALFHA